MRRCEDEKMIYRPPLLEEPFVQTLSGKRSKKYIDSQQESPVTTTPSVSPVILACRLIAASSDMAVALQGFNLEVSTDEIRAK